MTEIRCPMCGKSNPPELDNCQFCQARLTPLIFSPTPGQPDDNPEQPLEDSADLSQNAPDDSGFPDWLSSFRNNDEFTQDRAESDEPLPDWLAALTSETPASTTPQMDDSNPSDWLESLRTESSEVGAETSADDLSSGWMPAEPGEEPTTPDWLYTLRSTTDRDSTASDSFPEEEEPDWLKRIRDQNTDEEQEELQSDGETPVEDEFSALQDTPTTPVVSRTLESQLAPIPEEEETEIPAWLEGLGEGGEESDLEELPEWLKSGETPQVDQTNQLPVTSPFVFDYVADQVTGEPEPLEEEIPDWLAALQEKSGLESESSEFEMPEKPGAVPDLPEVPSSSAALEIVQPSTFEGESEIKRVQPFTPDVEEEIELGVGELPDWIKTISPEEQPAETPAPEVTSEDLELAALPVWLEAMRPVEVVAPAAPVSDESDRKVEASGPLAGLHGILRAEPDIARQHKPAAIPLKIQISDANQAQVDLLQEMLRQESQPRSLPEAPRLSQPFLVRLLVFILLLVGVGWPVLSGSQGVVLPQAPGEALMLRRLIDTLPNSETILVAVDYEPGLSGEMDAAASVLLDHLMIKGSYFAFVSTLPNGPLQAERLLGILNQRAGHAYTNQEQYINLGFIPGGSAGLLAFAETPRQVMPYSLAVESLPAWQTTRLAQVQQLSDFKLVVVLTENADTARAWVEQVEPALGDTPLVLVTSAQAEPMLRPYFDSPTPQVGGMIAGLAGAAAYESTMPRQGLARRYWDAFSYGLGTALVLILVMIVVNISLNLRQQRRQTEAKRIR